MVRECPIAVRITLEVDTQDGLGSSAIIVLPDESAILMFTFVNAC